MRLAVLATLACLAVPARADVVRSLERGMKWAGGKTSQRMLYVSTRKGEIELNPDGHGGNGVITLMKGFHQTGYFLEGGKVAASDRQALSKLLEGKAIRKQVVYGLRRALREHREDQKRLASVDAKVDELLHIAKSSGDKEIVLHDGRKAGISFRPGGSGPILVLTRGLDQHGIFLSDDGKGGYTMHPQDRADIARALLAN